MGYRRADGVVYEVVEDKAMLVDVAGQELLTLNVVGTLVWGALTEFDDPAALAHHLVSRFEGVTTAELEEDIRTFLSELAELGLVVTEA